MYICIYVISTHMCEVLYVAVPLIHFVPCVKTEYREFAHYECPCYKASRTGLRSLHDVRVVCSIVMLSFCLSVCPSARPSIYEL